ncbi:MAG TPA: serine hydrolase, partial [Corynebacterium variabile]|nr:serine hydrolase [Corynebacterium variabile]
MLRSGDSAGTPVAATGDLHHVFDLASVSKLVSAYAVLIAVSEGCFSLEDTVADVAVTTGHDVDGPQDATVRELLSHA